MTRTTQEKLPGSGLTAKDEGTTLSSAVTSIDFVGAGVTATNVGGAVTVTIPSGTTSPGGVDTQIQFNDGGSFGGDAGLTYNKTTDQLTVGGDLSVGDDILLSEGAVFNWDSGDVTLAQSGNSLTVDGGVFNANADMGLRYGGTLHFFNGSDNDEFTIANTGGSGASIATFGGTPTSWAFDADVTVPDEAYGSGWNGSLEVPTKNAVYDKIETLGISIGATVTSGTSGSLLYVGSGPVLAQTSGVTYISSDNIYFDQTGTGADQDSKGIYFKPTYSDGTVRTTFGVYAKAVGANTYPELIIGGIGSGLANIRIRSLTGAGESIYFNAAELNFTGITGVIHMPKLYLSGAGETPHTTERLYIRNTSDVIAAGFEVAHYGSNPQEIVYIHNNPWTGASSGGVMYTARLRSTTTDWNLASNWTTTWATDTHASRKARATFNVYDTAIREAIRIEASGSAAMVGFYGGAAVVQAANTTDLGTVLSDLGLRASGTAYPITTSGAVSFTGTIGLGGQVTVSDAINFALNTTTGTKWGTATDQKQAWWNATPIVQPTTAVAEATFVENAGGVAVNDDSTFDGYTLRQVVKALRNEGLLA